MLSIVLDRPAKNRQLPSGSASQVPGWMLLSLAAACAYYLFIITLGGALSFLAPIPYGLTFNSMLSHLLVGRFDVDPQTIGDEGILRHGLVYAYFGILPALLRLPVAWLPNFANIDFTRLASVAAIMVMAGFKLLSIQTVWQGTGAPERRRLFVLFTIAVLLSGPQIQFLRPSIFQEVVLWAGALSAAFVYFVLRGYYSARGFSTAILNNLALIAGLCLLTRVSTALGLYIALGLLWLHLVWCLLRDTASFRSAVSAIVPFAAPIAILLIFAAIAGCINFGRWGDPFSFTDSDHYLWAIIHAPERLRRVQEYGQFNLIRLGYNLIYYFFPIWILRTADGSLLWSSFQQRVIDSVELPPSSFFLSDPLIIGLAIFCLVQLIRHKDALDRAIVIPVLAGLAVPIGLILTLISATFRYRMEFYPFFEFCAFLGFGMLLARPRKPPIWSFGAGVIGSVLVAHFLWLLYALSPAGNATIVLGNMDVASYYLFWLQKIIGLN
jgi:hypothetical protein